MNFNFFLLESDKWEFIGLAAELDCEKFCLLGLRAKILS